MKKLLAVVLVMVCMSVCGCVGGGGDFAAGSAAGGIAIGGLDGMLKSATDKKQELLMQLQTANTELETSVDDAQKVATAAKIGALKKQLEEVQLATDIGSTAKAGLQTNWSDPAQVGGWVSGAIGLAIAEILRRKNSATAASKATVEKKYDAMKTVWGTVLASADPAVGKELYDKLGNERKARGV